jgi:hypothetical protein
MNDPKQRSAGPVGHHNGFCHGGKRIVGGANGRVGASWFETHGVAMLLTMRVWHCHLVSPHPEGAAVRPRLEGWAREERSSSFPRHDSPELCLGSPSKLWRAQGVPDAGRTREPCVQRKVHFAHASNDRAAETTGTPCAMVLRLIRGLLGAPGSLATVASRSSRGLIPASGNRDRTISPSASHAFVLRADASIASRLPRS